MISLTQPVPLSRAVDSLSAKTPLGTALRSRELEGLPADVRRRAFFSAGVEHMGMLERLKRDLLKRVQLERRELADGGEGTFQRRDQFLVEMQGLADEYGIRPTDDSRGTIEDIGSFRRLRLIWDTQVAMAEGYAAWRVGQSENLLNLIPARELVRLEARVNERDWPTIWREAMGELGEETGAIFAEGGRMFAPANDPIWVHISYFGNPFPPFRFGSGMGLRNVRRRKAERLGLIGAGERVELMELDFNDGLRASARGFGDVARDELVQRTGGRVGVDDEGFFAGRSVVAREDARSLEDLGARDFGGTMLVEEVVEQDVEVRDFFGDFVRFERGESGEYDVLSWTTEKLDRLIDRAERRLAGERFDKPLRSFNFGRVDAKLAERIREETGLDFEGYRLNIGEGELFKILEKHGVGREKDRRQRPIDASDFYHFLLNWRKPQGLEAGSKERAVRLIFDFDGKLMSVLWNQHENQRALFVNSMYARKGGKR